MNITKLTGNRGTLEGKQYIVTPPPLKENILINQKYRIYKTRQQENEKNEK